MGIEPTSSAWKAEVLPLNYTRYRQPTPVLRFENQSGNQAIPIQLHSVQPHSSCGGGRRIRTSEG